MDEHEFQVIELYNNGAMLRRSLAGPSQQYPHAAGLSDLCDVKADRCQT